MKVGRTMAAPHRLIPRTHTLAGLSALALLGFITGCGAPAPEPPAASTPSPVPAATPAVTPASTDAPSTATASADAATSPTAKPAPKLPDWVSRKLTDAEVEQHRGLPGVVRLSWKTQSEENNFGFHVMRGDNEEGTSFTKVNDRVIAGAGNSSTESVYEFYDTDVKVGDKFFYYLEDIDFSGNQGKFSPVLPRTVQYINLRETTVTLSQDAPTTR